MARGDGRRWATPRYRWAVVSPYLLAGLLGVAGIAHFARPEPYVAIVPHALPAPRGLVYASGVAELLCGAGLALPRTRRRTAWVTAALFVVVFPANVQMALDGGGRGSGGLLGSPTAAWLRLPLQVPLVFWAVGIARRVQRPTDADAAGE